MNASDGLFNSGTENVTKALTAAQFSALSEGTHTIYVNGQDAAGNWGATQSATFVKDTVAPTGTIAVNSNDPYTSSTSVTLNLSAADLTSKVVSYRVAEAADCSSATFVAPFAPVSPYSANVPFTLSSGDGSKTVCAQYKDAAGNISSNASD